MTADPRAALQALTSAFERHLEACSGRRGDNDPAVVAAYQALADAFEDYDDALMEAFNEVTPLEVYAEEEFDEDDDLDEDDFEQVEDDDQRTTAR